MTDLNRLFPELNVAADDGERHRERVLNEAVEAGKIGRSRLDDYRERYERDPVGTQQLLASLAPVPGVSGEDDDGLHGLFPELRS